MQAPFQEIKASPLLTQFMKLALSTDHIAKMRFGRGKKRTAPVEPEHVVQKHDIELSNANLPVHSGVDRVNTLNGTTNVEKEQVEELEQIHSFERIGTHAQYYQRRVLRTEAMALTI